MARGRILRLSGDSAVFPPAKVCDHGGIFFSLSLNQRTPVNQDLLAAVSSVPVVLPRTELRVMIRLVRALYRLCRQPAYRALVEPELPAVARFDPGYDSVMMGYDFHLTPDGPRLIEVNTNAGGGLLAWWAQQPEARKAGEGLPARLQQKLRRCFAEELRSQAVPQLTVILDENPAQQFLYPEMQAFTRLFEDWGGSAVVADPAQLQAGPEGVWLDGRRVELIYNRHCDFYLQTPQLAGVRAAYLAATVCLTPNPRGYGLLGDKRRMILWSNPEILQQLALSPREQQLLLQGVPESRLLADLDRQEIWRQREDWVFKPVDRFGSRGVFLGRKISKTRFEELPAETTLVQRQAPPSVTPVPGGNEMKTDFRLFVYRRRILGVAARIYQGQVTNLRTPGGGFAPIRLS